MLKLENSTKQCDNTPFQFMEKGIKTADKKEETKKVNKKKKKK